MTTYFQILKEAKPYLLKGLLLLHWKYWTYPEIGLSARAHWSEPPYDPDMHCRCSVKNLQLQTLDGAVVSSTAKNLKQVLKIKHQYSVTDLLTRDPLYCFKMTSVIWHYSQQLITHSCTQKPNTLYTADKEAWLPMWNLFNLCRILFNIGHNSFSFVTAIKLFNKFQKIQYKRIIWSEKNEQQNRLLCYILVLHLYFYIKQSAFNRGNFMLDFTVCYLNQKNLLIEAVSINQESTLDNRCHFNFSTLPNM